MNKGTGQTKHITHLIYLYIKYPSAKQQVIAKYINLKQKGLQDKSITVNLAIK